MPAEFKIVNKVRVIVSHRRLGRRCQRFLCVYFENGCGFPVFLKFDCIREGARFDKTKIREILRAQFSLKRKSEIF